MGMKKTKYIKIGFIGAGYMAEEHIKVFHKFKNVELVSIFSRTYEKAYKLKKKYNIEKIYKNLEDFCKSSNIDLLVLAVNEESLFEICKKTFKENFLHLIEKPVGINYEQSKLLNNFAKKNKSNILVSLNRRFYSSTKWLKKQIQSEKGIRIINIIDQENTITPKKNGINKVVIENWMYANSIHLIDLIYYFTRGEIKKIEKKIHHKLSETKYISCKIIFSSGDIVNYQAFWNLTAPWSLSISTKKNYYLMQPLEKLSYKNNKSHNFTDVAISEADKKFKPGIFNQNFELINSLLNKNKKFSLPNIKYSNKLMKLIKDIYF